MAEEKLRDFAPVGTFAKLGLMEKADALHRGFLVLLIRGRRQTAEISKLRKRVEVLENSRRKKRP